jgi:hypothetical protein
LSYTYFLSGSPEYFQSTQNTLIEGFQSLLTDQFYNSSTNYTIQEELTFGSGIYTTVDVRINRAVTALTGVQLGDDFKQILFPDLGHSTGLGYRYFFDGCYWLTVNTENIKNLAASVTVRRANNMLKWIDQYGNLMAEPAAIDYEIRLPRDDVGTENPVTVRGMINVYTQLNQNTKNIRANQRFLFGTPGNMTAFRVFGDGVRNFLNQATADNTSPTLLMLSLNGAYINDQDGAYDDLVNGIADYYKWQYSISLYPSVISGSPTTTMQLVPSLTLNGNATTGSLTYSSTASSVATVSASGLITLVSSGSCNVVCAMTGNSLVSASAIVTVSASPTLMTEIVTTPNVGYILEGDTVAFTTRLYLNGVQQANAFTFAPADANVPVVNYTLTTLGSNSFSVANLKKYLNYPLNIKATSGSYTSNIALNLKGSW